ncbi:MAG: peptidoglycan DD-metalloendopeptidase family protein [Oscillospiraceae bacterium]|nr:peptidoglycan DD-metalloendopeptidase family protein [Oscillospiraceae bacterium]
MDKKTQDFFFEPPVSSELSGEQKKNPAVSALINLGALLAAISNHCGIKAAAAASKAGSAVKSVASEMQIKEKINAIFKSISESSEKVSSFMKGFVSETKESGFGAAVKKTASSAVSYVKNNRNVCSTFVNHAVPVAAVALLISVVHNTATASYGIMVEYDGKELGVVTAESVVAEAQTAIAEKAVYHDTQDEIYVTANLSIKPLNALDEVIDEVALAEKIEEQIIVTTALNAAEAAVEDNDDMPVSAALYTYSSQTEQAAFEQDIAGKVKAYPVKVNGEVIGVVEDSSEVSNYLEAVKAEHLVENVVSVSFDKEIEYDYQEYVDPSKIVETEDIIAKLESIVSEPVYYEVQKGDSPWNIARDNDMSLDELVNCFATFDGEKIDDITEYCPIGATIQLSAEVPYLQVMETRNVTYTETVDYEIIQTEDPDMYKGDKKIDVKGVEGEAECTALITYKNGIPVETEVLERVIISEPVAQEQRVGTRKTTTEVSTGSGGSGDYFWPVGGGYISDHFGGYRNHKGLDIAAPYGTPIYAAESGTVTETGTGWNGGYGNAVKISHDDGNVTYYAHMSSIAINYGDYVVKGQLIGYVGSTGSSTGNHLHFEVRAGSYYENPENYVSQY